MVQRESCLVVAAKIVRRKSVLKMSASENWTRRTPEEAKEYVRCSREP
jgi:hypothetical protein